MLIILARATRLEGRCKELRSVMNIQTTKRQRALPKPHEIGAAAYVSEEMAAQQTLGRWQHPNMRTVKVYGCQTKLSTFVLSSPRLRKGA
jgi:hypothetical protein